MVSREFLPVSSRHKSTPRLTPIISYGTIETTADVVPRRCNARDPSVRNLNFFGSNKKISDSRQIPLFCVERIVLPQRPNNVKTEPACTSPPPLTSVVNTPKFLKNGLFPDKQIESPAIREFLIVIETGGNVRRRCRV